MNEDGYLGEQLAFKYFWSKYLKPFQADIFVKDANGNWIIVEAKYQDIFTNPYGHGLPPKQVAARIKFYKDTGIRCLFLVFDKDDKHIYSRWLDELNDLELNGSDKWLTKTGGRVIFGIEHFKVEHRKRG